TWNAFGEACGLLIQGPERRMVDAPVAGHLIDDQLAIALDMQRAWPPRRQILFQGANEPQIFRSVVGIVPRSGPFRRACLLRPIGVRQAPACPHPPARIRFSAPVEIKPVCWLLL